MPALNALYELHPGHFEARIGVRLSKAVRDVEDDRVFFALYLVVCVNRAWNLIDQPSKNKIELVVKEMSYEDFALAAEALGGVTQLRPVVEAHIRNFNLDQLAGIIGTKGFEVVFKERAIEFLAASRSWDRTNAVFNKVVFPITANLQAEDATKIIKLISEHGADLPGAHGFGLFVQKVRDTGLVTNDVLNPLLVENRGEYLVLQQE